MTVWSVTVSHAVEVEVEDGHVDVLMDALAAHGGALGMAPGELTVILTVEDVDTALEAAARGHALTAHAMELAGVPALHELELEAVTADVADRRLAAPALPVLVAAAEVAEILGVSRQRVHQLKSRSDFPEPVAELKVGSLWLADSIRAYAANVVRRNGRPRESA